MTVEGEPAQPVTAMDSMEILKHMLQENTATGSVLDHTTQMVLFPPRREATAWGTRGGDKGCHILLQVSRLCRRMISFPALPRHVSSLPPCTQPSLYSSGRHRVFVPLQKIVDTGWCL